MSFRRVLMIKIRSASPSDLPDLVALEAAVFSDPYGLNQLKRLFDDPNTVVLVCEGQDSTAVPKLMGYLSATALFETADINHLGVWPSYRRQGIGAALIRQLMETLKGTECHRLMLEVRSQNLPAIGLYQKMGFVAVGLRRGYYTNPKDDALLMDCLLNET